MYRIIANRLAQRGHEITILAGYYGNNIKEEKSQDSDAIKIIWIPLMKVPISKLSKLRDSLPPSPRSLYFLARFDFAKFDVIHLMAFGHLIIDCINILSYSKKKILTIHGFPKYVERSVILKLLYRIYMYTLGKLTLESSCIITVPSTFVKRECEKRGIEYSKTKIVAHGIDLHLYNHIKTDDFEKKYGIAKDEILLLSIARIVWLKGLEYGIEAIYNLKKVLNQPIKYMIIGPIEDDDYFASLSKMIEELDLASNIVFTGYGDLDLKVKALSRANIFVIPSLHESFGLVALEAMAMKKPIVASNREGIPSILKDKETGLLINPINPAEVSNAILNILRDSKLRDELSKNAFNEVKKYDWNIIVNIYEELYRLAL